MYRHTVKSDPRTGERYVEIPFRGSMLLEYPVYNKGSAFTPEERRRFDLEGLVPPVVSTIERQLARVHQNFRRKSSDIEKYVFLVALQDRNETLFYRLLLEHVEEMMPIVYTPTVGAACKEYSHLYRRPRGLYLTPDLKDRLETVLRNAPSEEVDLIVCTDGERVLGLGDLGAGGIGIAVGKICLYVLAAGIHPSRTLPVVLDVGTENEELLQDPLYVGTRRRRIRGAEYDSFLDAFVEAVAKVHPKAVLQWEDFGKGNAFRLLDRYRERVCSFDDDIEGTGAVTLAALIGAMRALGTRLRDHTYVSLGAGQAGAGIAHQLLQAMEEEGLPRRDGLRRIWMLGSKGLLRKGMAGLADHQHEFSRDPEEVSRWKVSDRERIGLLDVIRNARPSVLIGTSGVGGSFPEEALRALAAGCARPVVFMLSNPTANAECTPEQAVRWTEGRALLATGSPFPPVFHEGRPVPVAQANNVFIFPGVGLGAIVSRARRVTDRMFLAAARALAEFVPLSSIQEGRLLPPVGEVRRAAAEVALAVAREAGDAGLGDAADEPTLRRRIETAMWTPEYLPYRTPGE
ncbi:MAG TPA: NAD-dependent malic enzyme [Planctomycetota bacterium]|jgi:malate dehydrogenase (oxaloacetate-decarboxylating)|nr:NAD-dependent malic enzyme [Planctomycetota bacterium]